MARYRNYDWTYSFWKGERESEINVLLCLLFLCFILFIPAIKYVCVSVSLIQIDITWCDTIFVILSTILEEKEEKWEGGKRESKKERGILYKRSTARWISKIVSIQATCIICDRPMRSIQRKNWYAHRKGELGESLLVKHSRWIRMIRIRSSNTAPTTSFDENDYCWTMKVP